MSASCVSKTRQAEICPAAAERCKGVSPNASNALTCGKVYLKLKIIKMVDDREARVRFVNHKYDYRLNWTTQSLITN